MCKYTVLKLQAKTSEKAKLHPHCKQDNSVVTFFALRMFSEVFHISLTTEEERSTLGFLQKANYPI